MSHRDRLSGAQYKKLAKARLEKEEKVIASTPKLDSFFSKCYKEKPNPEIHTNAIDNLESLTLDGK